MLAHLADFDLISDSLELISLETFLVNGLHYHYLISLAMLCSLHFALLAAFNYVTQDIVLLHSLRYSDYALDCIFPSVELSLL